MSYGARPTQGSFRVIYFGVAGFDSCLCFFAHIKGVPLPVCFVSELLLLQLLIFIAPENIRGCTTRSCREKKRRLDVAHRYVAHFFLLLPAGEREWFAGEKYLWVITIVLGDKEMGYPRRVFY